MPQRSRSRSPLEYQRLKSIRSFRNVPHRDQAETALPRYEQRSTKSVRRGERRMGRWLKYS